MTMTRIQHALHLPYLFLKILLVDSQNISPQTLAKNRRLRGKLHQHAILSKKWSERDLKARREYWYKQMYFFVCLIKKMEPEVLITKDYLKNTLNHFIQNKKALDHLILSIEDNDYSSFDEPMPVEEKSIEENIDQWFIEHLPENTFIRKNLSDLRESKQKTPVHEQDFCIKESKYSVASDEDFIILDDVTHVITDKLMAGFIPVVNNAANSNRDGSAKYSKGSLEEHLSRHTNDMFDMLCHFKNKNKKLLRDFKHRYLRACLSMMQKILCSKQADDYINSTDFLNDYLNQTGLESKNKKATPIHFDLQNTVYEVPANKGHYSFPLYCPIELSSFSDFENIINNHLFDRSIIMIHAAAPDVRRIEGLPDKLCSSDPLLRNPEDYGTLRKMIIAGINLQCAQAVSAAKSGAKPYIIFILPDCGALGNPLHETIEIFLEQITKHQKELNEWKIPFCIVEKNPKTFEIINHYLNPPKKPGYDWKTVLACFTFFLIVPFIYLAWIKKQRTMNERYHAHHFFQLKNNMNNKSDLQDLSLDKAKLHL